MSVIICKHCSKHIDTDHDVDHEEMCGEENMNTNQIIKQAQEKIRNSIYPLSRLSPNENINPDFLEVVLKIDKIVDQAITQAVEEKEKEIKSELLPVLEKVKKALRSSRADHELEMIDKLTK